MTGQYGLCFKFLNIFLKIMIYTGLFILCFFYFHHKAKYWEKKNFKTI